MSLRCTYSAHCFMSTSETAFLCDITYNQQVSFLLNGMNVSVVKRYCVPFRKNQTNHTNFQLPNAMH